MESHTAATLGCKFTPLYSTALNFLFQVPLHTIKEFDRAEIHFACCNPE